MFYIRKLAAITSFSINSFFANPYKDELRNACAVHYSFMVRFPEKTGFFDSYKILVFYARAKYAAYQEILLFLKEKDVLDAGTLEKARKIGLNAVTRLLPCYEHCFQAGQSYCDAFECESCEDDDPQHLFSNTKQFSKLLVETVLARVLKDLLFKERCGKDTKGLNKKRRIRPYSSAN